MDSKALQEYEPLVNRIARFYSRLYLSGQNNDVDIGDLEQAGRIAVWQISERRPEKLSHKGYVAAAIKYSIFGQLKKMRHKVKQVYVAQQHEEQIPITDILPTKDTSVEKVDSLDELFYHIKQEFSSAEAESLKVLVDKCEEVYDLNISEPPTTSKKEKVRLVTMLDLNDVDLLVYAQVLLSVKSKFPNGWLGCGQKDKSEARNKGRKLLLAVVNALGMSSEEFARLSSKSVILDKYALRNFAYFTFGGVANYVASLNDNLRPSDVARNREFVLKETKALIKELSEEEIPISEIASRANVSYQTAFLYAKTMQGGFDNVGDYREYLLAQRGFKTSKEYQDHLDRNDGFESKVDYQKHRTKCRQKKIENRKFSQFMRNRLAELGKTQISLAREIGATPTVVCYWANGKQLPHKKFIKPLFTALKIPYETLDKLLENVELK